MSLPDYDRERLQTSLPAKGTVATLRPASTPPPPGQEGSRRLLMLGIGLSLLVLAAVVVLVLSTRTEVTQQKTTTLAETTAAQALRPLAHQGDLITCRNTLQQMNILLSRDASLRASLTPEEKTAVVATVGLTESDQTDLNSRDYTLLDGQYLESCLLFHDAAQALTGGDADGPALVVEQTPAPEGLTAKLAQARLRAKALERARAAFAWSVREVRLQPHVTFLTPPKYALRRGWGSELERALVFLSLLHQMGPDGMFTGCLLFTKDADGKEALWACGVLIAGDDRLFLFDPRIGLPLPGPDGTGVASLQEAVRDPRVLAQLTVDKSYPYDISAEQASQASVRLFCPLSGLAPRARKLQGWLRESGVPVRLAVNALAEKDRLTQAARSALGDKAEVSPWLIDNGVSGASVLRQFLPQSEGGTDVEPPTRAEDLKRTGRLSKIWLFQGGLLPMSGLPVPFNNPIAFPIESGLGKRIHQRFVAIFVLPIVEPGKPRDLMLRGDFAAAGPKLREDRNLFDQRIERADDDPGLRARVDKWLFEQALPAYERLNILEADRSKVDPEELTEAKQRVEQVMANDDVHVLLDAGAARNVLPELTYLQALCKHEEAEQMQARLAGQIERGQNPNKEDLEEVQNAWLAARGLWREYLSRSREFNSVARVSCYRSYVRAIRMSGDPPSPPAASGFVLAGANARPCQIATSCYVLSAAENARLNKRIQEELGKALDDLNDLTDANVAAYVARERVAILLLMHRHKKD